MTQKAVEKSLVEQLKAAGADIEVFRGLISDYLAMFRVCEQLKKDIQKRGAIVEVPKTQDIVIMQPNSSIKELRDTSKSMLAILKQLGLNIDTVKAADADDEL